MSFNHLSPEKFAEIHQKATEALKAKYGATGTRIAKQQYRTHCLRGHAMTPENSYVRTSMKTRKDGSVHEYTQIDCRICMKIRDQKSQAKRRLRKFKKVDEI